MIVVVVVVMIVVPIIVVVAMIFMIPMAFMHLPPFLVVVIVRMGPVSARIRRSLPDAWNPDVVVAARTPITIDPRIAFSRHGRSCFIADWWRRDADIDLDLAERLCCQGRRDKHAA